MNDFMGLASLSMITGDSVIYLSDINLINILSNKSPNDRMKAVQLATEKHDRKTELVRNHFCPSNFIYKIIVDRTKIYLQLLCVNFV